MRDQSSLHARGQEKPAVVLIVSTLHETVKTALTLYTSVKPVLTLVKTVKAVVTLVKTVKSVLTLVKTVKTVVTLIKTGLAHKGVGVSALLYYSRAYG